MSFLFSLEASLGSFSNDDGDGNENGKNVIIILINNNLITYIAAGIHKNDQIRITLVIKAWKKKTKQNKKQQEQQNYKPFYNQQNNKNIYTSAIKI